MNYDNVLTIDLETSIKNKGEDVIGKQKASPFCKDNAIVMYGWRWATDKITCTTTSYPTGLLGAYFYPPECVVGHNIKFDMLYLLTRHTEDWKQWWDKPESFVWDTQLAEYILSGQTKTFPSLDYCAEKRGGTLKDDRIKEYWNAGVDTEDIPEDQLAEYLKHDVENTELVFRSQLLEAEERGMLPLMYTQMRALKATIEMEYNGMEFDLLRASDTELRLSLQLKDEIKEVEDTMAKLMPNMKRENVNAMSNDQISVCLFGGIYKETVDTTVFDEHCRPVKYKTGKRAGEIKTKKVVKEFLTSGLGANTKWTKPMAKAGVYSTDEKVLKTLCHEYVGDIYTFCHSLLRIRELSKDINTYYVGYSKLTWPDHKIHGSLNHCNTATGRLSSSSPNLQNLSGGK